MNKIFAVSLLFLVFGSNVYAGKCLSVNRGESENVLEERLKESAQRIDGEVSEDATADVAKLEGLVTQGAGNVEVAPALEDYVDKDSYGLSRALRTVNGDIDGLSEVHRQALSQLDNLKDYNGEAYRFAATYNADGYAHFEVGNVVSDRSLQSASVVEKNTKGWISWSRGQAIQDGKIDQWKPLILYFDDSVPKKNLYMDNELGLVDHVVIPPNTKTMVFHTRMAKMTFEGEQLDVMQVWLGRTELTGTPIYDIGTGSEFQPLSYNNLEPYDSSLGYQLLD